MDYAAARLVESRNVASITCVPYLFFPGMILRRNVLGGLDQIQERYPEVAISITPPLRSPFLSPRPWALTTGWPPLPPSAFGRLGVRVRRLRSVARYNKLIRLRTPVRIVGTGSYEYATRQGAQ